MKIKILILLVVLGVGGYLAYNFTQQAKTPVVSYKTITPQRGNINAVVSTTGTIQPQNRLELKPQVNGRLEEVLVKEGDSVRKGAVLAWMSSTERAALLDAARNQDKKTLDYWVEVYKPTPLIAPISGEVIVRSLEPGQTVGTDTPVLVLSDRLIIKAQVDETDIGKISLGQSVAINLDAYPDQTFTGSVNHIAYESRQVNNVIIYDVDITVLQKSKYFRSGMGANVIITTQQHRNVLTLPQEAIDNYKEKYFVLVADSTGAPQKKFITLGLSDDKQSEILSGLSATDKVLVKNYQVLTKKKTGTNPFMPARAGAGRR